MSDNTLTGYVRADGELSGIISKSEELSGVISFSEHSLIGTISYYDSTKVADETLIGYIEKEETILGSITSQNEMVGVVSFSDNGLIGTLNYGSGSKIPEYLGPYFTIPTADIQLFETKNKKMLDDFTVDATPISDVRTSDTDGYTITVL